MVSVRLGEDELLGAFFCGCVGESSAGAADSTLGELFCPVDGFDERVSESIGFFRQTLLALHVLSLIHI